MWGMLLRSALVAASIVAASSAFAQDFKSLSMPPLPPGAPSLAPAPLPPSPIIPPPALPSPALPSPSLPPLSEGEGDPNSSALYQRVAALYAAGKYEEAQPVAEEYVAEIEHAVGNVGLPYANAISLLSRIYQIRGRFDDAEQLLKRSIEIREGKHGSDSPDVATELDALAQIYDSQGRFNDAQPLFERALAISEKNAAADLKSYGRELNAVAWIYQEEGRYAEAEPRANQALDILKKSVGTEHPDYGCALDTLAKLYEGEGNVKKAEPLYRQALAILERSLGPEHVSTAVTRENLGGLLKSQGHLDEAESLLNRSLSTKKHVLGFDHPNLVKTLSQLGDLYRLQGKPDAADKSFASAFAISRGAVKEIPVFFATDRKLEGDLKTILFGGSRSDTVKFGQATIVVPSPETAPVRAPVKSNAIVSVHNAASSPSMPLDTIAPVVATTELTRLAIRKIDVISSEGDLMKNVARRLGTGRPPGEALVFVHGCCTTFENALRRAAQIAYDIHFEGATFLFSWPSSGEVLSYGEDRETVDLAARHLKEFLEKIVAETKVTKIHFVAHSMGNMVVLQALEKMSNPGSTFSKIIGEVIDAAPDVDPDLFKTMVESIKAKGGNFTLYASRNDWALWASSKFRNRPRAGYIKDKPLIDASNFDTIDITQPASGWFDFNWFALNHDVYASSPVLVADMQCLIEQHEHPPDRRTKEFEPIALQEGTYWLFHRPQPATAEAESGCRNSTPTIQSIVAPAAPTPSSSAAAAPPRVASPPSDTSALAPNAASKAAATEAQGTAPPETKQPQAASTTTAPVKTAHRKKRKQDIDPDWNTKPLH